MRGLLWGREAFSSQLESLGGSENATKKHRLNRFQPLAAVRPYRTVSPLPRGVATPRRFVFCGTFPEVAPAGH